MSHNDMGPRFHKPAKLKRLSFAVVVLAVLALLVGLVSSASASTSATTVQAAPAAKAAPAAAAVSAVAKAAIPAAAELKAVTPAARLISAAAATSCTNAYGFYIKPAPSIARAFPRGEWAGTFFCGGGAGVQSVCITPGLLLSISQAFGLSANVGKLGPAALSQLKYMLNVAKQPSGPRTVASNVLGAAYRYAIDYIAAGPQFVSDYHKYYVPELNAINGGIVPQVNAYLAQAKSLGGNQTASFSKPGKLVAGQKGTEAVHVTTAAHSVSGEAVSFAISGGKITAHTTSTDKNGNALVYFIATSEATVHITATVTIPNNRTLLVSRPAKGQQTLVARALGSYKITAAVNLTPVKPTNVKASYKCTNCGGTPPVTECAPATGAGYTIQYGANLSGTATWNHVIQQATSAKARCILFNAVDRQIYTFGYRYYLGAGKWSAWTRLPGRLVIDCPPWLTISFHVHTVSTTVTTVVTTKVGTSVTTSDQSGTCTCVKASYSSTTGKPQNSSTSTDSKPVAVTTTTRQLTIQSGVNKGHGYDYVKFAGTEYTVAPGHSFKIVLNVATGKYTVTTSMQRLSGAPSVGNSLAFTVV